VAKPVTVSGFSLSGPDATNYNVLQPAGVTADISPAALTLAAASDSRAYDGTANSSGTVGISGLYGSDSVTGATQSFASQPRRWAPTAARCRSTPATPSTTAMAAATTSLSTNTAPGTITRAHR
jgi:hypothetical protein